MRSMVGIVMISDNLLDGREEFDGFHSSFWVSHEECRSVNYSDKTQNLEIWKVKQQKLKIKIFVSVEKFCRTALVLKP